MKSYKANNLLYWYLVIDFALKVTFVLNKEPSFSNLSPSNFFLCSSIFLSKATTNSLMLSLTNFKSITSNSELIIISKDLLQLANNCLQRNSPLPVISILLNDSG